MQNRRKPLFVTDRLYARVLENKDFDRILAYRLDERCARYQRWGLVDDSHVTTIIRRSKAYKPGSFGSVNYGIILREGDGLIGDLYVNLRYSTITVGFTLAYGYWHMGYATEAVRGLIIYLSAVYPDHRIIAMAEEENTASVRVLGKTGFVSKGYDTILKSLLFVYNGGKGSYGN